MGTGILWNLSISKLVYSWSWAALLETGSVLAQDWEASDSCLLALWLIWGAAAVGMRPREKLYSQLPSEAVFKPGQLQGQCVMALRNSPLGCENTTQAQCVLHPLPLLIVHLSSHHYFGGGGWMTLAGLWWKPKWPHSWCFQHVIPFCWCCLTRFWKLWGWHPTGGGGTQGWVLGYIVALLASCCSLTLSASCLPRDEQLTSVTCSHRHDVLTKPMESVLMGWTFWTVSWRRPFLPWVVSLEYSGHRDAKATNTSGNIGNSHARAGG